MTFGFLIKRPWLHTSTGNTHRSFWKILHADDHSAPCATLVENVQIKAFISTTGYIPRRGRIAIAIAWTVSCVTEISSYDCTNRDRNSRKSKFSEQAYLFHQ